MSRAVVVGSGPNGLAAALKLASAGFEVDVLEARDTPGGGTRSCEATLPGLVHDECSGFHPLAVTSPFATEFDLRQQGLEWRWPEVQYAHPLVDGGGHVVRSVAETAADLGPDGTAYQRLFGPLVQSFSELAAELTQPAFHRPRRLSDLARFGRYAALPASMIGRSWSHRARATWAGVAAHAFQRLDRPTSAAVGLMLGAAAHATGWPVASGGSVAISNAMLARLEGLGAHVHTGVNVTSLAQIGSAEVVMLDTSPSAAARIVGERLPARVRRAYERFRHGPGAFQVAFAVEGGVPWSYGPARRAGTVHVCGGYDEVAAAEREVNQGRLPQRPFVLVGQQHVADPSRGVGGIVPVDTYAHVPNDFSGDATQAIAGQIERFAPGFRERVIQMSVRNTATIARENANYVGGDIITGANDALQLVARPRLSLDPYFTGVPGVYLCSAATPPGAGAHGLCGYHAATSALRRYERRRGDDQRF